MDIAYDRASAVISNIDNLKVAQYAEYWNAIAPTDDRETFQRWLFAYASVHTTWESNIALFNAIKGCEWIGNKEELRQRIIESRAGLYNNRADYITDFADKYWDNPAAFKYVPGMSWVDLRCQIGKSIHGLGRAKIAFAYEMIYPTDMRLVCVDTHILN